MAGKGDHRRRALVSEKKVQANWDKVFPRKEKKNERKNSDYSTDSSSSNGARNTG